MADWEADDFEPELPVKSNNADKWEGEDEDDDVKDAWDAESEEENSEEKKDDDSTVKAVQRKKKKKLADIIAEKEEEKNRQEELLAQERLELEALNTPEAKLAEKLRLQRLDEANSLQMAREMLGVPEETSGINFSPSTKEEFDKLSSTLVDKLRALEASEHFNSFGETLLTELCTSLNVPTLKKVKGSVEGMISAKLKEEKANKGKGKGGKGAGKATIRMDTDRSMFSRGLDEGYDDMDDFM